MAIYGEARKPNYKVEWPKGVRSLFSRLCTGHAKELKHYRHRIQLEEDALCKECLEEDETTEHILCRCGAEEMRRHQIHPGGRFTPDMMITHPEECRELLERRFEGLKLPPDDAD